MRRFISIIIPCLIIGLAVLSGELGMKLPDGTDDACFSGFYFKGASWLTLLVEFVVIAQLPVFLFLIVRSFLAKDEPCEVETSECKCDLRTDLLKFGAALSFSWLTILTMVYAATWTLGKLTVE